MLIGDYRANEREGTKKFKPSLLSLLWRIVEKEGRTMLRSCSQLACAVREPIIYAELT